MNKATYMSFFRRLGLAYYVDWGHFYYQKWKNKSSNQQFRSANPDVKLPPDYLMYECFQMNYNGYYNNGKTSAQWLIDHFQRFIPLKDAKILDWGCGIARTIRHFPTLLQGKNCKFYGTDYNSKSIEWCRQNINDVEFSLNGLQPPLNYPDNYFDVIYGISIFTHLSEKSHYEWFSELLRVIKPSGIILITMHGEAFRTKLSQEEQSVFDSGQLVIRDKVKEGHRTFGAFHPQAFMKTFLKNVEILQFIEGGFKNNIPQQDTWILRKKIS